MHCISHIQPLPRECNKISEICSFCGHINVNEQGTLVSLGLTRTWMIINEMQHLKLSFANGWFR